MLWPRQRASGDFVVLRIAQRFCACDCRPHRGGGASGYSNNLNNRVLDTVGDMTKALKEDADTKAD